MAGQTAGAQQQYGIVTPAGKGRARFPARLYSVGNEPDPRFSFANERTFLAWIRTALALLAAGIALDALPMTLQPNQRIISASAMVIAGLSASWHAWWSWYRSEKAMRLGRPLPGSAGVGPLALLLLMVGFAIGLFMWTG